MNIQFLNVKKYFESFYLKVCIIKPRVQDCVFIKILQILPEPQKKCEGFQAPQLIINKAMFSLFLENEDRKKLQQT